MTDNATIEKLKELQEMFDNLPTGFLEPHRVYKSIFLGCSEKSKTLSGKLKVELKFKVDCITLSQMYLLNTPEGRQEFKNICVKFFDDTEEPVSVEERIENANKHINDKYMVKYLSKSDFRKFEIKERIC